MPAEVRRAHQLPKSHSEWGRVNKVDSRSLHRWRNDPGFEARLAARLEGLDSSGPTGSSVLRPAVETPEQILAGLAEKRGVEPGSEAYEYLEVRATLLAKIRDNDLKAAEAWLKLFGAPHIAAERAESSRLFSDLGDDELVDRALALIGEDRVAVWLAGRAADV